MLKFNLTQELKAFLGKLVGTDLPSPVPGKLLIIMHRDGKRKLTEVGYKDTKELNTKIRYLLTCGLSDSRAFEAHLISKEVSITIKKEKDR